MTRPRLLYRTVYHNNCRSKPLVTDIHCNLFPACLLSLLVFTPESPRWLVLRGKDDEAIESLRRYLGKGLSTDDPIVQDEYKSIKEAAMIEKEANVSLEKGCSLQRSIESSQAYALGHG